MTMKDDLVEMIESRNGYIGDIQHTDIIDGIIGIFSAADSSRMKRLYDAYLGWQERSIGPGRWAKECAQENIDLYCHMADMFVSTGDEKTAINLAVKSFNLPHSPVGDIRRFYRESVGYFPVRPELN